MEIGSLGEYLRQSEEMPLKVILSNPTGKDAEYRRYVYVKKKDGFQREAYTKTQVFHRNLPAEELAALFADITPGRNEYGEEELCFRTPEKAARFADLALACSRIYVSDADRYAMQLLAELLRDALAAGVLTASDLEGGEEALLEKLRADALFAARWRAFRALSRTERAEREDGRDGWRLIRAKKRWIDPFVSGRGRVSELFEERGAAMAAFLAEKTDYYVRGE